MKFYDVLSKYYDIVFPYSEGKKTFLMEEFNGRDKILDVACGSGTYSLELAREDKEVTALDLDEKMIELLKAKKGNIQLTEMVKDMTHIKDLGETYDGIFCIGNSIVHLSNREEIEKFIKNCFDVLNPGGKFIIQIINYNKIFNEELTGLPTIERPDSGLKFVREYGRLENGNVEFKGKIQLADGNEYVNSVQLVPVIREELESYLKDFSNVNFYGGFDKKPWSEKTMPTVVVAEK